MLDLANLASIAMQSVLPSLYAATASDVRGGTFFGPTGSFEHRGAPGIVRLPERALDANIARALWEVSEQLTQVHFPFLSDRHSV